MSWWRFKASWCLMTVSPGSAWLGVSDRTGLVVAWFHFSISVPLLSLDRPSLSIWARCEMLTCPKTYRIPLFSLIWGCHTWFKQSCHGKPWGPSPCTHTQINPPFFQQPAHLENPAFGANENELISNASVWSLSIKPMKYFMQLPTGCL